jgi:hypothetical protein
MPRDAMNGPMSCDEFRSCATTHVVNRSENGGRQERGLARRDCIAGTAALTVHA